MARRGRKPKDYLGNRAGSPQTGQIGSDNRWKYGQLHYLDNIPEGDPKAAVAIQNYAHQIESNRQCFPPNTLVTLKDGTLKPISQLVEGEKVESVNTVGEITKVHKYNIDEDLIELKAYTAPTIKCTKDHKFPVIPKEIISSKLRKDKDRSKKKTIISESSKLKFQRKNVVEKRAEDISSGDWLILGFYRERTGKEKFNILDFYHGKSLNYLDPINPTVTVDEKFLRLVGLYLAEGSIDKNGDIPCTASFAFGTHEVDLIKDTADLIYQIFGKKPTIAISGSSTVVKLYSSPVAGLFSYLCDDGCENKKIHEDLFTTPHSLLPLVGGWIDGDGNSEIEEVRKVKRLKGTTVSINLISQIRSILLDENVSSIITTENKRTKKTAYNLILSKSTAKRVAPHSFRFKDIDFGKGSTRGYWIDDNLYAVRVYKKTVLPYKGEVYDLSISSLPYYQIQNVITHNSRHWVRAVQFVENILFLTGRHYIDDILVSRLARDSDGNTSTVKEVNRFIPRPINDLLGRYVETNIALFTENRPRPRVTSKSDRREDQTAAELSEYTMEFLWEKLNNPEKQREVARLILAAGTCWKEIVWDPTEPRLLKTPVTVTEKQAIAPAGAQAIQIPLTREVTKRDEGGFPEYSASVGYGDITSTVVSPFEMHLPVEHWWNGDRMGWIMREYYTSIEQFQDRYGHSEMAKKLKPADGWHLDRLEDIGSTSIQNLPLWWWERMADLVEGPGPSLYVGTPEAWENHTVIRWLDRKPNPQWPRGRSILIAGNQVIYDSPKEVGARAYDPRWPHRWHPYVRFRWEPIVGSLYGRSLISKLLPKLKRVNAIDTTMIMWRRTVPIATWISPKGAHPVDDIWSGRPGLIWEYDARRTQGKAPEPVFPPPYPEAALREREQQIAEMEAIAGTEEILRGQRPTGVTNARMIEILRKQALASRSAILQSWDESQEEEGSALLQETMKHVRNDPDYAERIRLLAREKHSRLTIQNFSGTDLSDNVIVRVDTASMALVSKEAKEAKAIEFMQYAPGLMSLPFQMRQAIVEELGFAKTMTPQGPDVERAKMMVQWIKQNDFERVIPFPEDDPYIFMETLSNELKSDSFWDFSEEQQRALLTIVGKYKDAVKRMEEARQRMMMMQAQAAKGPPQQ